MSRIELSGIQKTYAVEGKELNVLNGIHLQIENGKITVILGKSGCGKTTLLRIAGGLENPDIGEVNVNPDRKIGFVFQEARLMPWLNVWENVGFGLANDVKDKKRMNVGRSKGRQKSQQRIQQAIDKVGLNGFEKAYPHQLSGGMQQRVAIARAFVYEPAFIMMDEPFAALDHFTRRQMQKELLRLQKESSMGILFVTHSIDEAMLLGHKIIVIENGRIKAEINIEGNHEMRDLMDPKLILQKRKIMEQLNL